MICRDDGNDWLLISQVEHAHLAGEIAAVWGNDLVPPLPFPDLLVPAIAHHDDGWADWERAPEIDPATARPRDFTEMPMADATAIWRRSIESCAQHSAWGGLWVSRHFCYLAEKAREGRRADRIEIAPIDAFLADQSQFRAGRRRSIADAFDTAELDRRIELGFRWVQFFDAVSLWLCCAPRSQPWELNFPGSPPAGGMSRCTFTPQSATTITIHPDPLAVEELDLSVTGIRIPQREYGNDQELLATLRNAPTERLQWTISRQH